MKIIEYIFIIFLNNVIKKINVKKIDMNCKYISCFIEKNEILIIYIILNSLYILLFYNTFF